MSQVNAELLQILRSTLSQSADVRREAENMFLNQWVPRPSELFPQLLVILLDSNVFSLDDQCLAAVFFRRWIARESLNNEVPAWRELPEEVQTGCKSALIESFLRSNDRNIRNRIADAISQVASLVAEYEEWKELMEFIIVSITSPAENDDSIGALLRIITATPDLFSAQDINGLTSLVKAISSCSSRHAVVVEMVQALTALAIFFYSDEQRRPAFTEVVTMIIPGLIQQNFNKEDEEELTQLLSCCSDLVYECPRLFSSKKQQSCLFEYLSMASALIRRLSVDQYDEEDSVSSSALEFICAAVEGNPGAFRRDRALLEASALLLLEVTGMESNTEDWLQTDPNDEEDIVSMSVLGQQSLDRFAIALGGSSAGPILFSHIGKMLTDASSDWRKIYAALMGIASSAEGCAQDFLEDHLDGLLALIWPCFSNNNPRIQYASCHALGQLCTDFPGRIQSDFARDSLSSLISLLQKSNVARVQCHAAAALVNFAEGCEAEIVSPFLDGILGTLSTILSSPNCPPYLKEQLLASIAAYSGAAQSRFAHFLDRLLPLLISCLDASQPRKVQCRAVEAVSLVLLAVKGSSEVQAILSSCLPGYLNHLTLLEESLSSAPADDPMREFLPSAWLRIAQLMGREFAPWLQVIVPSLLNSASSEIKLTELPDNDEDIENSDEYISAARVNGRNVGINTAALTEKASALETLASLITAVGPEVFPDANNILSISQGLINFEWSSDVRAASVECSVAALECLGYPSSGIESVIAVIIQGLENMYETEFACASFDALSAIFLNAKKRSITMDVVLSRLHELLPSLINLTIENIRQLQEDQALQADFEDDTEDDTSENGFMDTADEEEVLYAWGRLQAALFECFPTLIAEHGWAITFSSSFIIGSLTLKKNKSAKKSSPKTQMIENEALQHVCLGVLCDALEWLKEAGGITYGQAFIDSCIAGLSSHRAVPLVRQVSAHLSGQIAQYGGSAFREFCVQAAGPILEKLVTRPEAKSPSQLLVTDNVVSALIRIHAAFPGSIAADNNSFISRYIVAGLPVISDEAEINSVARFLMQNYDGNAVWAPSVLAALVTVKTNPCASVHLKPELKESLQPFLRDQLATSSSKDRIISSLTSEQIARL